MFPNCAVLFLTCTFYPSTTIRFLLFVHNESYDRRRLFHLLSLNSNDFPAFLQNIYISEFSHKDCRKRIGTFFKNIYLSSFFLSKTLYHRYNSQYLYLRRDNFGHNIHKSLEKKPQLITNLKESTRVSQNSCNLDLESFY